MLSESRMLFEHELVKTKAKVSNMTDQWAQKARKAEISTLKCLDEIAARRRQDFELVNLAFAKDILPNVHSIVDGVKRAEFKGQATADLMAQLAKVDVKVASLISEDDKEAIKTINVLPASNSLLVEVEQDWLRIQTAISPDQVALWIDTKCSHQGLIMVIKKLKNRTVS
jgi:hypothetical protein